MDYSERQKRLKELNLYVKGRAPAVWQPAWESFHDPCPTSDFSHNIFQEVLCMQMYLAGNAWIPAASTYHETAAEKHTGLPEKLPPSKF